VFGGISGSTRTTFIRILTQRRKGAETRRD
jgi:hypothetical protein